MTPMSDETAEGPEPVPIAASLDGVVRSLRGPGRAAVGGVFGQWVEIVGDQVAQHVQPTRLDGDVLAVDVDDPAWATQVRLLSPTIIGRVRETTGLELGRLDVRVARR